MPKTLTPDYSFREQEAQRKIREAHRQEILALCGDRNADIAGRCIAEGKHPDECRKMLLDRLDGKAATLKPHELHNATLAVLGNCGVDTSRMRRELDPDHALSKLTGEQIRRAFGSTH